ncbi:MAG TPA: HAD family hydrolase [Sedimentisphaerales bacterium]|jgi:2-hydroxy-3-keto-5-methylthiopentenyl-1-phosphate phosphatase|nr:HAD family hydrolase [Sedimentisphaerales bacterium]HNU31739.1 HAD family hydrolase [Sedimentisphaerales bacterium]
MSQEKPRFIHNVIAIVYDFDGTLTPQPMQEYTVLPELGIKKGREFWEAVRAEALSTGGEEIVTYMRLMIEMSKAKHYPVTPRVLRSLAKNIQYYPGVAGFFRRISDYVTTRLDSHIELRHYVLSAGLKEIICGASIARHFHKIFASEYHYNEYDEAVFPKVIVNDTLKTQFIFRINKGKEALHESINLHMPPALRPVPFQNILYIGDGLTDVPCMTVIRKNGGYAIAVYEEENAKALRTCKELLRAGRVDFIAQADYRGNKELDRLVRLLLNNMVEGIRYARESFDQSNRYLS